MVNYRPIPPATKRGRMSMETKLAAALAQSLDSWSGDHSAKLMAMKMCHSPAKDVIAMVDFHHRVEIAIGGDDEWWNIIPIMRDEHHEHTAKRKTVLAKTTRQRKAEEKHRLRVSDPDYKAAQKMLNQEASSRVRKIPIRPFPKGQRPMRRKP